MTDLATLGFEVNSKPLDDASKALDKVSKSAKGAEKGAHDFEKSASQMSQTAQKLNGASSQTAARLQAILASIAGVSKGLGNLVPGFRTVSEIVSTASVALGPEGLGAVLSGLGGIIAAFGNTVATLLIPVLATATAGTVLFGSVALAAAIHWRSAQRDITAALTGIGSTAGVTVEDINQIAMASAQAQNITVESARQIALAFASTGKIGASMVSTLSGLTKGAANLFGGSQENAAKLLAKAFADPARGVDTLNARLATFDAATRRNIINLTQQNRLQEAQNELLAGSNDILRASQREVGSLSSAWSSLTSAVSQYFNELGKATDRALGGGSLEDQRKFLEQRIRESQQTGSFNLLDPFGTRTGDTAALQKQLADVMERIRALNKAAAEAPGNQDSLWLERAFRRALPEVARYENALNGLKTLKDALANNPAALSGAGLDADDIRKAIAAQQDLVASEKLRLQFHETADEAARRDGEEQLRAITAVTAQQRAQLAFERTLRRERAAGNPAAEIEAQSAATRVLAQESHRVTEEIKARNFAQQQSLEYAKLEASLVGQSADVAERATAALRARQQVLSQAFSEHRTASSSEIAQAEAFATQQADIESGARRNQFMLDLQFERDQLLRSPIEQEVFSRLQSAGLLTNNQIQSAQARAAAGQIRFNAELERTLDLEKTFASTFVNDIMQGKSAVDALTDALGQLAQKLINNELDSLLSGLNQNGGIGSLFGGLTQSSGIKVGASILHAGGIAGNDNGPMRHVPASLFANAPRYHSGGIAGDEVPAILKRGEKVYPVGSNPEGGGVVININNNSGAQVQTQKRQMGDQQIVDVMIDAVGSAIGSGRFDKQMGSRYGARAMPVQR